VECYSTIIKNEILPFAMMWMELEIIMVSEISQSEKDKYHMISLICGIEETKQINQRGRKDRGRKTKKQTLNCRKQTDGLPEGEVDWEMG